MVSKAQHDIRRKRQVLDYVALWTRLIDFWRPFDTTRVEDRRERCGRCSNKRRCCLNKGDR